MKKKCFHQYIKMNVNLTLSRFIDTLHFMTWILLVYGLLIVQNVQFLYFSLFFSIFIFVEWQIATECLFTHIQYSLDMEYINNPTYGFAHRMSSCTGFSTRVVYSCVQSFIGIIVCIGFYRLYSKLSKRVDFK